MDNNLKELDLEGFLNLLLKRKKAILSFLFIFLILGFVLFFVAPSEHIGKAVLEIGLISRISTFGSNEINQSLEYIEEPIRVAEKINNKTYGGVDEAEASYSKDTSLVEIKVSGLVEVKVSGKDYEEAEERLEKVISGVIDAHSESARANEAETTQVIEVLDNERQALEQDISFLLLRGQQVGALRLETRKIELMKEFIKSQLVTKQTEVVFGPAIEEKRPSYLIIILSGFLGLFLGMVYVVFAEKFLV